MRDNMAQTSIAPVSSAAIAAAAGGSSAGGAAGSHPLTQHNKVSRSWADLSRTTSHNNDGLDTGQEHSFN